MMSDVSLSDCGNIFLHPDSMTVLIGSMQAS